jgi:hypothetical protein
MSSLLGNLFGAPKAVEQAMGVAKELLDDAWYTGEEKAADRAEARREAQGLIVDWLRATTGSRLARRVIAFAITGTWLAMKWISWLFSFAAVWAGQRRDQLLQSSHLAEAQAAEMTAAVMLILGFYFAAPYMGELARGALQKFSKTPGSAA